jgi:hypothetical protein
VVRAGLVQKQLRQEEEGKWHILPIIKPGDTSLQNFKLALNSLLENLEKESHAHKLIMNFIYSSEPLSVARFGNILESLRGDKKYLLVIDQFEEVFTLTPEQERETFLDLITSVADIKDSPLKVVITMRADFLGSYLSHAALKELIEKDAVYIAPITTGLIETIIQEPAKRQGYTVEQDLINTLIQDTINEPGYLPLLEFTLEQLWNKNLDDPDKVIRLSTYSEESESGQSGLKKALNLHAERVYNYSDKFEQKKAELKRSAQEKEWIRLIFLRLVRTGKGDTDTRQRQERQNLLNIVQKSERQKLERLIESLIKGRLLVSDKNQIDLAHEALISGWEQFKTWRIEDREIRRTAERLEDARNEWKKNKNDQLLIGRALLAQVRENWKNLKPYLLKPKATEEFYRLSDQYEKAEKLMLEKALLEARLQLDATRVERLIAVNEPIKSLTLAIQVIGKNRERLPEKLVGLVGASLRHVVEKIFTPSPSYGHTSSVKSVAFSPDGQTIVSGSGDNTVRLWKLDGTPLGNPFTGHTYSVNSVAFSPDGQTIVSGSNDKTVRLWKHVGWRDWLRTCLRRLGNNWTDDKDGTAARARLFEEGYTFAEDNEIEEAIVRFQQALQCGKPTLISETPNEQLTPEKLEASAQRLIAPILLEQGQRLARFGNFDGALAKFEQAKQFNSDLTIDPVAEAKRLTAPILRMQGTFAALEFNLSEAIAKFTQAKQYAPDLEFEPETEAKRLAAPFLVEQGKELAKLGKVQEAIAKFTQAKQYAPDLEFEPETEAKRLAAPFLVEQGKELAKLGKVQEAIDAYQTAQTYDPDLEISVQDWNNLCWYGVLHGATQKNTKLVKDVLAFSQKALENSEDFNYRDTLGVAKVLTGGKRLWKSAIKDFEYYVQLTRSLEKKEQRQRWINALKKGENPFTEAEIQTLLNQ